MKVEKANMKVHLQFEIILRNKPGAMFGINEVGCLAVHAMYLSGR